MDTAVYVHFPWCVQKCPYCDFASQELARGQIPGMAYADALTRELHQRLLEPHEPRSGATECAPESRRLCSVFFGGGTPSLWAPAELGRVLRAILSAFERKLPEVEVSVECNPTSLDRSRVAALREAGVNRLSVGVQSLDDGELRFLGRQHDAHGALQAVRAALGEMTRVSADTMFGLPGQSPESFCTQLEQLLDLGLPHLSCYALTVEPATRFGSLHRKGRLRLATEDTFADTFQRNERFLGERGLEHYEVSNYARAGQKARHNEHYWRGGSYLGLGAGAVGCLTSGTGVARRYRNHPEPTRYLAGSRLPELEVFSEALGPAELEREALMLGLRTAEGVDLAALARRTGCPPLAGRWRALERLRQRGDVVLDAFRLRVPPAAWLRLDGIVAELF